MRTRSSGTTRKDSRAFGINPRWRLCESLAPESFWISAWYRQRRLRESLQILWEGQQLRLWQEAQLHQFSRRLGQFEFEEQDARAQRMRRAVASHTFLSMARWAQDSAWKRRKEPDTLLEWWLRLAPRGWLYHNAIAWDQSLTTVSFPGSLDGSSAETVFLSDLLPRTLTLIPALHLGSEIQVAPVPRSEQLDLAFTEACLRLARTACALELYRLRHGHYPESLERLVPDFLHEPPSDPMVEGLLRYRQPGPGKFVLYSVGANRIDGGGVSGPTLREGDWVWRNDAPSPH